MNFHSVNNEQGLYVMKVAGGYTTYGFEVLDRKARAVAAWSKVIPPVAAPGTRAHFDECNAIMEHGARYALRTGSRCDADLVPALIGLEGKRVEATYFGERVRFIVGKSTGWMPCHLLIKTSRSMGGEGLLRDHVTDVRVLS